MRNRAENTAREGGLGVPDAWRSCGTASGGESRQTLSLQSAMPAPISAGLLLFRRRQGLTEVLLVHPGGPYWAKKDAGAWSIPKGKINLDEDALAAARREFHEETGSPAVGTFVPLPSVRQRGGKLVHAWAFEGDLDTTAARSNTFEMEWPPKSGRMREFPEIDRVEFFALEEARTRLNAQQAGFLDSLERLLAEQQGDVHA